MNSSIAIVGPGRLGTSLARSLRLAGYDVSGPHGHGFTGDGSSLVLLCVPDGSIAQAAALIDESALVGHTSGASSLSELGGRAGFGLHPLMTFPGGEVNLEGVWCAVSGTGAAETVEARRLADATGMRPFEIDDADRAAYHAAASIASNFLVTLQAEAASLAAAAGAPDEALVPLVKATVANWAEVGPERALTGPVARGDTQTVARQRAAVAEDAPQLLPLFDALVERTELLALRSQGAAA